MPKLMPLMIADQSRITNKKYFGIHVCNIYWDSFGNEIRLTSRFNFACILSATNFGDQKPIFQGRYHVAITSASADMEVRWSIVFWNRLKRGSRLGAECFIKVICRGFATRNWYCETTKLFQALGLTRWSVNVLFCTLVLLYIYIYY